MQAGITWTEVAIRLGLTLVAGMVLGANRGEHGRPAGLRTTVLVCLTASASLILANLLMSTTGRPWNSYVTMDVMRLPLGILTGMGFIGAGAILHKGNLVVGVTTAATLWFTTMMGFCLGSGEIGLGLALLGLGIFVLWCLEWVENNWKQRQEALLTIISSRNGPACEEIAALGQSLGYKLTVTCLRYEEEKVEQSFQVHWYGSGKHTSRPALLDQLTQKAEVWKVAWTPTAKG